MDTVDVGALLKQAREDALLSQRGLAARLGIGSSTLSRYESGVGQPSLAMLDHILAGCGRQLQATLVTRHADLDAELERLDGQSHQQRCQTLDILTGSFLQDLGSTVLIGGAWAAALHGLPTEHTRGRLWLAADDASLERYSARMRRSVYTVTLDGEPSCPVITPALLRRHEQTAWTISCVGACDMTVMEPGRPWPDECRMDGDLGMLRVTSVGQLGPEQGVRPDILERWLARRG